MVELIGIIEYYMKQESQIIKQYEKEIDFLKKHIEETEVYANPTAQESRRKQVEINIQKLNEAAERNHGLYNILKTLEGDK